MRQWSIPTVLGLLAACLAAPLHAGEQTPDLEQLLKVIDQQNKRLEALSQRVQQLEAQQTATRQAIVDEIKRTDDLATRMQRMPAEGVSKLASWAEKIKWGGDLRYRHEFFDRPDDRERHRHRVRARLKMHAKPSDELDVYVRLASGSDDPVSTNQTLGDGFSTKGINLDRAYLDFHPEVLHGMHVLAGKMKNPFFHPWKGELIWDGDLNPEGLAITYSTPLSETMKIFAKGGHFWLDENKDDSDKTLVGVQTGVTADLAENMAFTLGGSYFQFNNLKGDTVLFDEEDPFGNTAIEKADGTFEYAEDFHLVEAFAELAFKAGGIPVSLHGNFVNNVEANGGDDTGWFAGVKVGKAKKPGEFEFKYNYRRLEADAVVGLLTDSDFIGGGTDGKGHEIGAGVKLTKDLTLAGTLFLNDRGVDDEDDFKRAQVDLKMKF